MKITICDMCKKKANDNGLSISLSGYLETKEKSGIEYHNKHVCSKCYVKFRNQFMKVFSPLGIHKSKVVK